MWIFILTIIYNFFKFFVKRSGNIVAIFENTNSESYLNLPIFYQYIKNKNLNCKYIAHKKNISKIYFYLKAKIIIIDQADPVISKLPKQSGLIVIQVWHAGGAYKCFGFDAARKNRVLASEVYRINRICSKYDYVVVSDSKLRLIYSKAFALDQNKVLPFGLLRTDLFFNKQIYYNNINWTFNKTKKNLLLSPSFLTCNTSLERSTDCDFISFFNSKIILDNFNVFVKIHPSIKHYNLPSEFINVSKCNLYEVLSITNILITDFSSIIFDFSFFHRPIIIFSPNYENYISKQRNLYYTPDKIVGKDMFAKNFSDVLRILNHLNCNQKIWEEFMSGCDGNACLRLYNFITKYVS